MYQECNVIFKASYNLDVSMDQIVAEISLKNKISDFKINVYHIYQYSYKDRKVYESECHCSLFGINMVNTISILKLLTEVSLTGQSPSSCDLRHITYNNSQIYYYAKLVQILNNTFIKKI